MAKVLPKHGYRHGDSISRVALAHGTERGTWEFIENNSHRDRGMHPGGEPVPLPPTPNSLLIREW